MDLSDGCRLSTAFKPCGQGRWPNPEASRAEPLHVELTRQVCTTNGLLTAADTLGGLSDGEELFDARAQCLSYQHVYT